MPGESSSGRLGDGPVHSNCHVFWHYSHINLGSNHADQLTTQTRNFRHLFVSSFTFILHLSTWINKGSFMIMNWRFTCAVCLLTSDGLPCLGQVTKCLMADCLTTITLDPGLSSRQGVQKKSYILVIWHVKNMELHTAQIQIYNHPVPIRIKSALRILWWWSYLDKCLTSR